MYSRGLHLGQSIRLCWNNFPRSSFLVCATLLKHVLAHFAVEVVEISCLMALAPTLGIANATSLVPNNFQYLKQWHRPQARLPFSHEFHIEFYSQFPCLRKMAFAAGGFFWSFVDGRVPIAILRLIVGRCFKLMIFLELCGGSFD